MTLQRLGTLFFDQDEEFEAWLATQLDEPLLGLQKTATTREGARLFLVVTTERTILAGKGDDGEVWREARLPVESSVDKKLTTIRLLAGGEEVEAGRVADSDLVELWKIAFDERPKLMLELARRELDDSESEAAAEILAHAEELADRQKTNVAYLTVYEKILLYRAWIAVKQGHEPLAIDILARLSAARPGDDLISLVEDELDSVTESWWLAVALAHEEASDHRAAARVYKMLRDASGDRDDAAMYALCEARSHAAADDSTEALAAYETCIQLQVGEEFRLVLPEDAEDLRSILRDPGFVAACLESAEILEGEGRAHDAAQRYFLLIRHAPLEEEAYERLSALRDHLDAWEIRRVYTVLSLLDREKARRLAPETLQTTLRSADEIRPVSDEVHDRVVVHPRERDATNKTQKWLGRIFGDARDTSDIRRHCEPLERGYPEAANLLADVARLAQIQAPECFVSHGTTGIEVLGEDNPFILLGAAHLDDESPRCLSEAELRFAFGTQLEHVRAGHLMLTSSEFWRTFGTKSLTAVLALVPMGELLSKFTDSKLLSFVKRDAASKSGEATRKLLDIARRKVEGGSTAGGIQSAYESALNAVGAKLEPAGSDESLVKESLADFARSALYTADRFGLLAAADVEAAVRAIFKLSPTAFDEIDRLESQGLMSVLELRDDGGRLRYEELALRMSELLKFGSSDEFRRILAP